MKNYLTLLIICLQALIIAQNENAEQYEDTLKYQLGQVTVTATRYPENIIEIPYAVSIVTKEDFQNIKGYGLDEVLSTVPGVLAQSRAGNQDVRIVIRGFGARGAGDRSNSGTSRGIRIMLDGIPETEPDGRTSFDNIDLSIADNIEVIRSNSSALWGNASGGVVNVSSIPRFDSPFISVGAMSGSFGLQKFTFQGGGILGVGRLSVSLSNTSFEGWRKHSSSKRTVINIGLLSNLSQRTKLGVYLVGSGNLFHIPGPLTQEQFDLDPQQSNTTYLQRDERRYNRLGRFGVTLDHALDDMHEFYAMAYVNPKFLQRSERGTFRDFTRYHVGGSFLYRNNAEFAENVKNQLTVGFDESYQDGAILFYSLSATNGRGSTLRTNKREGANTFGAFIQNEIRFNENISLIVGGRYDKLTYYSEDFLAPKFGLQDKAFEKFTPKAGITYLFSQTHSVYFNLGGGVEVPAGNETDPASTFGQDTIYLLNPLLDPINSTTFEVGTKQLWFIGDESFTKSLSYDLAFYFINIKNDIIPYRGGRFYFTAGKTNRMGLEASLSLAMQYGLSFQGSFTYSINKYKDYLVDSVHYSLSKAGRFADYKNNKVAGIPDMIYFAALNFAPENFYGLYLGASINGLSKYFADDANTIGVPAFNIFNLSIGLKKPIKLTDNFSLRAFITVNNLTNKKYVASAFINPDLESGRPVFLEPGLPRNIVASVFIAIN